MKNLDNFLKLNKVICIIPEDMAPEGKSKMIEHSKGCGYGCENHIFINGHDAVLMGKTMLSEFQLRRASCVITEFISAAADKFFEEGK